MFTKILASSLLISVGLAYPTDAGYNTNTNSLDWAPCDLDFPPTYKAVIAKNKEPLFCATLTVPLDYTDDSEDGETVDLQLIKVKANKQPFKGSILTNPGGPGGSGVEFIAIQGSQYRDELGGFHDLIGFDPRGTGRTLPFFCNPSNTTDSKTKRGEYNHTIPVDDIYAQLANKQWHDGGIFAEDCANTPGMADIGPYIGTSFVARDMLSIIDALGEDKLQYWGISYGTVLGQTFAGMFPDRVGRIVLDSTVRFDDYHSGQWITVTRDTERTVVNFFDECIAAGPTLCPLANFTGPDTTAEDLHLELGAVIEELFNDPIYLPENLVPSKWYQPGRVPAHVVLKQIILGLAYRPLQFPNLVQVIDIALRRDWETAFALFGSTTNTTTPEKPWSQGIDAFHGISCSDGAFRASSPQDAFSWTQAQAAAGTFADGFGAQIWPCAQWKFDAKERYTGPWTNITTSFPILFVNGNHDPITPLSGAYEASANFPGSRLVVQNGHGHAVKNHPSKCTDKVVAEYFNEGKMPEVGKVCQTDKTAFGIVEEFLKTTNTTLGGTGALGTTEAEAPRRLDRLMV
ncbi:hypothetical protein G6514_008363 [Epicoccum nigrum]|nr:hypothetical protein G6514_008363 [Epicoccum nigrum]